MLRSGMNIIMLLNYQLYHCATDKNGLDNKNDNNIKDKSSITIEYLNLLKSNEPNGFKSTDSTEEKYRLVFKASASCSETHQDNFEDFFANGQINNTSKDDIRVNGKIYFEIIKAVLEDLLENNESLDQMIDFIKNNNCKKNNETLENMNNEIVDLSNYLKILLNFVYYTLYVSDRDIISFFNQIDVKKDCGGMELKDVFEIFFKTFLNTALGNQTSLGYYLEDSNKIHNDLRNLYDNSDRLKEYDKHKIEVISHFFGDSHSTSDVYLLEYVYVALYFSLNNILHFYNSLPKLIH